MWTTTLESITQQHKQNNIGRSDRKKERKKERKKGRKKEERKKTNKEHKENKHETHFIYENLQLRLKTK